MSCREMFDYIYSLITRSKFRCKAASRNTTNMSIMSTATQFLGDARASVFQFALSHLKHTAALALALCSL